MKKEQELFEIETIQHIRNKLDYIYSISQRYNNDDPQLMDTIASLTNVANMFAKIKLDELTGNVVTTSPQGYIVSKLGNSYLNMKEYEKQQDIEVPEWKL
ncbi:hypothetical protein R4Z10_09595 [Niallia sp. XMNu-256]|uniref:hypothetical protein n=1 Tax=Niallia sp. XMNu-256 TaxID=3082444 RepID=UPI0030CADB90